MKIIETQQSKIGQVVTRATSRVFFAFALFVSSATSFASDKSKERKLK
jgi:hypothetical protein